MRWLLQAYSYRLPRTPGPDEISAGMLAMVWPVIGNCVAKLFHDSLNSGTQLKVFKEATVLDLPKPGRRDGSPQGVQADLATVVPRERIAASTYPPARLQLSGAQAVGT